jgi:hypothetical protein
MAVTAKMPDPVGPGYFYLVYVCLVGLSVRRLRGTRPVEPNRACANFARRVPILPPLKTRHKTGKIGTSKVIR